MSINNPEEIKTDDLKWPHSKEDTVTPAIRHQDDLTDRFEGVVESISTDTQATPPNGIDNDIRTSTGDQDRDPNRVKQLIVGGVALAATIVGAVAGYNHFNGDDDPTKPRMEPSASASANPGEKSVTTLTPEQAIGIKQTTYESVNTPELANKTDLIERARQSVSSDTPLEQAVLEMGHKYNMYVLTGDNDILAAMYGVDPTQGSAETEYSEVIEETILAHKHSNDRFSYFTEYKPSQIIDKTSGDKVTVTEHESFVPLTRTGDLSYRMTDNHNTNFENVDRDEVFDNDLMDNSFSKDKEIYFKVVDDTLVIDTILYAN